MRSALSYPRWETHFRWDRLQPVAGLEADPPEYVRFLRPRRRVAVAALVVIALALPLMTAAPDRPLPPPVATAQPAHPSAFFDDRAFALALARVEASAPDPMPAARALIVPHHWLAGHLILGPLHDLAATGDYDRIILIGPNHTNAGGAAVITSGLPWQTPFGLVEPDAEAIRSLTADSLARSEPDILTYEHSVAGIVPAVAYYLPQARVVPLILRHDLTAADVDRLAAALTPLLDDRAVIVAAVDFSHYLSPGEARQRDGETLEALRSLDSSRLLSFGDEHLDSPASIAALVEVVRRLGATDFTLRDNTNSADLSGPAITSVTSYIAGYYR